MSVKSIEEVINAVEQMETSMRPKEMNDYLELKRVAEHYYALKLLLEVVRRPDFKEAADLLPKLSAVPKGMRRRRS
jgi:hypothetical protein